MGIFKKVIFIIILFVIISSCGAYKTPIKIGVNSWPPCEIWYIAEIKGYFNHTPVEIVRFSTWTDNMSALYLGNIDITHSTYLNALYFSDKGEDGQIILSADTIENAEGLVIKNYVENGRNLRGGKIAVEINTDEHFLLIKALEKYGLKEEDVTIVATTSKDAAERFISEMVDACFTYEPFLTRAVKEGNGKIIFTTKDAKGYMIDALIAKKNIIKKRKRDLINTLSAWYKAQEYIRNNSQETFQIMGGKEGMDATEFGDFYNSFTFFSAQENLDIFSSEKFKDTLREMNNFLYDSGAIYKKTPIEDIYNPEIIQNIR